MTAGGCGRLTTEDEENMRMMITVNLFLSSPSSQVRCAQASAQEHACARHSTTNRRSASMAAVLSLRLLSAFLLAVGAVPAPAPGRVPKVYNALITSNQNLEPSKSYPVYNPVLHDPFGFSLHPSVLYGGGIPFENGIPLAPPASKGPEAPAAPPSPAPEAPPAEIPAEAPKDPVPADGPPAPTDDGTTLPPPPTTESPISLNEFGLPSQVLPLGRINPAYNGFSQLGPYPYPYPGVRYYNPYDPFSLGYGFPIYRQLPNVLELGGYGRPAVPLVPPQAPGSRAPESPVGTPPNEPRDLNVLNYSSKDPAIPNVPPPPLPQGGLKSDSE